MAKPIRGMILVKKIEEDEKLSSGLYKPQTMDEKVSTGTVVATGSGHLTSSGIIIPLEIKEGNKILFNKNMAVEVTVNDEKLFLMKEEQVYCVL